MSQSATITFEITVDRLISPEIMEALDNLAFAMQVQGEDGLALQDEEGEPIWPPVAHLSNIQYTVKHNA